MSKSTIKTFAIVLLVGAAGLAFWGYQKSAGLQSQLSNVFTGSHSDNVMMLYIAGAACAIAGLFLLLKK